MLPKQVLYQAELCPGLKNRRYLRLLGAAVKLKALEGPAARVRQWSKASPLAPGTSTGVGR